MQGIIGFKDLEITCFIGDSREERERAQMIYVDLKVKANLSACSLSDNIQDTVNYVLLAQICENMAKLKKYHLLETFASETLQKIIDNFPVSWAWIKVKKPAGLPSAKYTFVEIEKEAGNKI